MDMISASGRVKSLEKKFLSAGTMDKLIQANSYGDFAGMLSSSFYDIPPGAKTPGEIEEVFEKSRAALTGEMHKNLPEHLYNYFILKYDYLNLGLLVENQPNGEKRYTDYASVDYRILREAFKTGNHKNLPPFLKKPAALIAGNKNGGMEDMSLFLKKSYLDTARELIERENSSMISYYWGIETDFSNIAVFIQKKISGVRPEKDDFAEGGHIRKERFAGGDSLWEDVKKEYRGTEAPIGAEIFEREKYNCIMRYIVRGRAVSFGVETVFFYFAAREIEMEIVKRLAMAKFYNIPPQTLSEWGVSCYRYA